MSKNSVTPQGCEGYRRMARHRPSRRQLLKGSAALASGVWLTGFAEQLARAADRDKTQPPKSLLMLWLQGGPSQLETFDPHAGTRIGGDTQSIATSVKGIEIADMLPATAEKMHLATLVRSLVSKEGDHERATYHLKTGWRPDPTIVHPSIGGILCHQCDGALEIPRHISIEPSQWPARGGYLGATFDAFQIGDPAKPVANLTSPVGQEQLADRIGSLLTPIENEFRRGRLTQMETERTLHQTATQRAVSMMSSEQLTAFDVHQESPSTLAKFGDTRFGRGCLAAIRLLSAGVRCVEVELNGWDSHINNHEIQSRQARILDPALAATLEELAARDLLEHTVVFCGGEFGRTPLVNATGGRDHWPHGFCSLLAGGPFRRGYVHGATAAQPDPKLLRSRGNEPIDPRQLTENPVTIADLHATLLHALDIDYRQEQMTPVGRPLSLSDGKVVTELIRT